MPTGPDQPTEAHLETPDRPVEASIAIPTDKIPDHPPDPPTTPAPSLPLILTVEETAALLRINRKTLYDLVRRNQLPGARKLGRALRFHRDALLRWMRAEPPRC